MAVEALMTSSLHLPLPHPGRLLHIWPKPEDLALYRDLHHLVLNGRICLGGTSHELDTQQIGTYVLFRIWSLCCCLEVDARDLLALMQVKRREWVSWLAFFPVGEFCIWA